MAQFFQGGGVSFDEGVALREAGQATAQAYLAQQQLNQQAARDRLAKMQVLQKQLEDQAKAAGYGENINLFVASNPVGKQLFQQLQQSQLDIDRPRGLAGLFSRQQGPSAADLTDQYLQNPSGATRLAATEQEHLRRLQEGGVGAPPRGPLPGVGAPLQQAPIPASPGVVQPQQQQPSPSRPAPSPGAFAEDDVARKVWAAADRNLDKYLDVTAGEWDTWPTFTLRNPFTNEVEATFQGADAREKAQSAFRGLLGRYAEARPNMKNLSTGEPSLIAKQFDQLLAPPPQTESDQLREMDRLRQEARRAAGRELDFAPQTTPGSSGQAPVDKTQPYQPQPDEKESIGADEQDAFVEWYNKQYRANATPIQSEYEKSKLRYRNDTLVREYRLAQQEGWTPQRAAVVARKEEQWTQSGAPDRVRSLTEKLGAGEALSGRDWRELQRDAKKTGNLVHDLKLMDDREFAQMRSKMNAYVEQSSSEVLQAAGLTSIADRRAAKEALEMQYRLYSQRDQINLALEQSKLSKELAETLSKGTQGVANMMQYQSSIINGPTYKGDILRFQKENPEQHQMLQNTVKVLNDLIGTDFTPHIVTQRAFWQLWNSKYQSVPAQQGQFGGQNWQRPELDAKYGSLY